MHTCFATVTVRFISQHKGTGWHILRCVRISRMCELCWATPRKFHVDAGACQDQPHTLYM
jgi:hypothetical protein